MESHEVAFYVMVIFGGCHPQHSTTARVRIWMCAYDSEGVKVKALLEDAV